MLPVREHPIGCANGHLPIAFGVPHNSETRNDFVPSGRLRALPRRVLRISWKNQPSRSIGVHSAVYALAKQALLEISVQTLCAVGRNVRLPSHPIAERQMRSRFPDVLRVEADIILAVVADRKVRLIPCGCVAQHEVGHGKAAYRTVERKSTRSIQAGDQVHFLEDITGPESKLVRSPHKTDIVRDRCSRTRVELTRRFVGGPERESTSARSRRR